MGLDSVELVMEVEEAFGIAIPDEEAGGIITVGDLCRYVLAHMPGRETRRCLGASTFFRLRRALIAEYGVDRRRVRPSTSLAGLMPKHDRIAAWQRLSQALAWSLPSLVRPAWMATALISALLVMLGLTLAAWGVLTGFSGGVIFFVVAGFFTGSILVSLAASAATRPWAGEFPAESTTVGDLAREVLARNYRAIGEESQGWNRADVWDALRALIVRQLGVPSESVTEAAKFVGDLGMD